MLVCGMADSSGLAEVLSVFVSELSERASTRLCANSYVEYSIVDFYEGLSRRYHRPFPPPRVAASDVSTS